MKILGCRRMLSVLGLFVFNLFTINVRFCHGNPKLVFANRKDIRMVDVGSINRNSTVLRSNLTDAVAIDILYIQGSDGTYKDSLLCWSDLTELSISCASMRNPSASVDIVNSGLSLPDGLAIDWIGRNLYWIDSETNRVEVCELLTGRNRKVLYWMDIDLPRGLALDPQSGYMFWSDWGEEPKIERAGMNGDPTTRQTIVSSNVKWPNGIAIDHAEQRLYWVDGSTRSIHSAALDGSDRREIVFVALSHPFAITVLQDDLYWTDWSNKSVFSCPKRNCTTITRILTNLYHPMGIDAFEPSHQPNITGENPCAINNGGCSNLCLLSPNRQNNCACPTGVRLLSDGKTCAEGASQMIFLARRHDLRMISLDTPDFTDTVIDIDNVTHAVAIDFDPVDRYVYWTDDEIRLIQRIKLDGTNKEKIVSTEVMNPDGIAVDWLSRNLFWTDAGTDRIEVARLNGSSRRVVVSDGLAEPRALALDPMRGWMYWTDWGASAKIERAAMDGTMREVLINTDLVWPNGIALDFEYGCLYWADAKLDKIERSNFDGTDRTTMVDNHIPHVFGFDIVGQFIYWTDWQRRTIERVDKRQPDLNRNLIIEQLPDLMGIRAISMTPNPNQTNDCTVKDGGCSHLCLMTPGGRVCACPMDMELLADGRTCIVPEAFLLFSQPMDIKQVSVETRNKDVALPLHHLNNVTALDIHIDKERVLFADNINKTIRHSFVNGSSVAILVEFNKESPVGIALDWISNNLYFIEDRTKRIEVFNSNINSRKVILWKDLTDPRSIAVYPEKGWLYWTDWGPPTNIGRSKLNGQDRITLMSNVGRAGSLAIDFLASRLFWVNFDEQSIQSSDLAGNDKQVFLSQLRAPVTLTIYDSYVYWFDLKDQVIWRASKALPRTKTVVQTDIQGMINLIVFHKTRQPGWSSCAKNSTVCQYFCFSSGVDHGHICECPTHYKLNIDNKTCSAPNSFLLLSERPSLNVRDMQIRRLTDQYEPDVVLPLKQLRSVRTLAYDPTFSKLYWIDGKSKTVKRSSINGSDVEIFLPNGIFTPASIALDPYSRMLFWSDSDNNYINVTSLSKSAVGVILNKPEIKPRAIVISPNKGYLFFINENPAAQSVMRMTLDGKNLTTIVSDAVELLALAIDPQEDRIYWSDAGTKSIKFCDVNGMDVKTLIAGIVANSLAVYFNDVYYAEDSTSLSYVDKISGIGGSHRIRSGFADITDVLAVNGNTYTNRASHPCAKKNGECSHICYKINNSERRCGCPEGLVLHQNMLNCEVPPKCKPTEFTCESGKAACIPLDWKCDGSRECSDGADEENCPVKCLAAEYQCRSGQCIDKTRYCNNVADCIDNSDEEQGRCCQADQFMCLGDFSCIPKTKLLDNVQDCSDGSDENGPTLASSSAKPSDPYAVGIIVVLCIVAVFIICVIGFIVWKCRRRNSTLRFDSDVPLRPLNSATEPLCMDHLAKHPPKPATTTTVLSGSSVGGYDRNHVTGQSSSSSSLTHLHAGYNPPPSPVTEHSVFKGIEDDCSTVLSAYPSYHNHVLGTRCMPVPPTTPISTCDDSEPSIVNFSTQKSKIRKKANQKYQLLKSSAYGATSEPFPPPPTPTRSQIFSADDISECPPSPTVRSFRSNFNPYPPPPSPEPTSDNS